MSSCGMMTRSMRRGALKLPPHTSGNPTKVKNLVRYCRKRNFPKPCSVHSYLQFTSGKLGNLKTTVVGKRKDPYMGNVCEILLDLHPQGRHGDQNALKEQDNSRGSDQEEGYDDLFVEQDPLGYLPYEDEASDDDLAHESKDKRARVDLGFRTDRATVDQILVLKELLAIRREQGLDTFLCFVDVAKAYDTVSRPLLWFKLRHMGLNEKLKWMR